MILPGECPGTCIARKEYFPILKISFFIALRRSVQKQNKIEHLKKQPTGLIYNQSYFLFQKILLFILPNKQSLFPCGDP